MGRAVAEQSGVVLLLAHLLLAVDEWAQDAQVVGQDGGKVALTAGHHWLVAAPDLFLLAGLVEILFAGQMSGFAVQKQATPAL